MRQEILSLWQENGTLSMVKANGNYDVGNEIIYYTEVLKPNLCDYSDAYILVR